MSARDDYSMLLLHISMAPPNPGFSLSRSALLSPEGLAEQQKKNRTSPDPIILLWLGMVLLLLVFGWFWFILPPPGFYR